VGLSCPECGAAAQVATCFLGMSADCVRHNPDSHNQTVIGALRMPPALALHQTE
jgi:hypothetical protein